MLTPGAHLMADLNLGDLEQPLLVQAECAHALAKRVHLHTMQYLSALPKAIREP